MSPYSTPRKTANPAMEGPADESGSGASRSLILGRTTKPSMKARKTLEKKMTSKMRIMAAQISSEVQASLQDKYNDEAKERMRREEEEKHKEKLRRKRDTRQMRKTMGRASRQERKSVQMKAEEAERVRVQRMSIEEKAEMRRKERKTLQGKSGGLSEFLQVDSMEDASSNLSNESMTSKYIGAANALHATPKRRKSIGEAMAALSPLSPLARSMTDSSKPALFSSPDDITMLCSDDFYGRNEIIRAHDAPINLDIHDQKNGKVFNSLRTRKKSTIVDPRDDGVEVDPEARALGRGARKTLVQRFKRAIRKTQNVNSINFALADNEKEMRKSRQARPSIGATVGSSVANGTLKATARSARATGFIAGTVLRLGARATKMAVDAAAPHVAKGGARVARLTIKALDQLGKEKDPKMTKEQRIKRSAAMVIQRNWRIYYTRPNGPRDNRAARIITDAIREYKHFIMHEKWVMLIEMEMKDKKQRARMEENNARKAEKDFINNKKKNRHAAERAARKTGWSAADLKGTKWTKRELAIMCACYMKHGFPRDDTEWPVFYKFFAEKPRRAVRNKLNSMKDEGSLHDASIMQAIDNMELRQMGLEVVMKSKKKKKAIELKDLL